MKDPVPTPYSLHISNVFNVKFESIKGSAGVLLEMSQDGQYYHYLTKWMLALNRMSLATGNAKYNRMAIDLAMAIHSKFFYEIDKYIGLWWKMSIDLTETLIIGEGFMDPFDGMIVYRILRVAYNNEVLYGMELFDIHC